MQFLSQLRSVVQGRLLAARGAGRVAKRSASRRVRPVLETLEGRLAPPP
jgi:hypothetical protein